MSALSDEQQRGLLGQVREGTAAQRERALAELLRDFRGPALAAIHKALLACGVETRVHAEEALQQAVFKFIAVGIEAYRGGAAPRTYFTRIAINAALDVARRLARMAHAAPGERPEEGAVPSAEERINARQRREALEACLEGLPERYRRSVALYYLEEAGDCASCARLAGVTRAAFMQQLCRARAMLADCIRRRLGGDK